MYMYIGSEMCYLGYDQFLGVFAAQDRRVGRGVWLRTREMFLVGIGWGQLIKLEILDQ